MDTIHINVDDRLNILSAKLQDIQVIPATKEQHLCCEEDYDGIGNIDVAPVTSDIDNNIIPRNIRKGISILGIQGDLESDKPDQTKSVKPSVSEQAISADFGYELAKVIVEPVDSTIDNNIKSENIAQGVEILGVVGTFEGGTDGEPISASDSTSMEENLTQDKVGKVIQYTGETNENYTNGGLYIVEEA